MKDLNYQLGIMVGEYIVINNLPTMVTDMIHSRNVVELSQEDYTMCKQLEDGEHKNWIEHQYEMAKKYLPPILECRVPRVVPENMELFKQGIRDALWDCDLCWYQIEPDELDIHLHEDFAWCITINLKLSEK